MNVLLEIIFFTKKICRKRPKSVIWGRVGGSGSPPGGIVLLIVRIVQIFQGIFVGINEAEIPKIGQFQYFVRTLWAF